MNGEEKSNSALSEIDIERVGHLDSRISSVGRRNEEKRNIHSKHLTASHGIIGCQLFTYSVTGATASPIAQIPFRTIQTIISLRTFFHSAEKVTKLEKSAHAIQALLAITLLSIAILRYQENNECENSTSTICKNEILFDTLYSTMLLISWGPAQAISHSQQSQQSQQTNPPYTPV